MVHFKHVKKVYSMKIRYTRTFRAVKFILFTYAMLTRVRHVHIPVWVRAFIKMIFLPTGE